MKKLLILLPFFLLLGASCNYYKNKDLNEKPTEQEEKIPILERTGKIFYKQGFEIPEDGFLYLNGERITKESVYDLLNIKKDEKFISDISYDLAFTRTEKEGAYVYLTAGAGCGGCVWFSNTYFFVDNNHNVKIQKLIQETYTPLFGRQVFQTKAVVSNLKDKIAYIEVDSEKYDKPPTKETVRIYDLRTGTDKEFRVIENEKTALDCPTEPDWYKCTLTKNALFWSEIEPSELIIQARDKNAGQIK